MNSANRFSRIQPWLKPILTILLGLALLFRPDSLTSVLGSAIGFVLSVIGAGLMIAYFFGSSKKLMNLISGIVLLMIGYGIMKSPLNLVSQFGRLIGILLLLQCFRRVFGAPWEKTQIPSVLTAVIGAVLLVVPVTASRFVISGCGIAILVFGAVMLRDTYRTQKIIAHQKPTIIDAE